VFSQAWVCLGKWFVFDADKVLVGGAADASLWVLLLMYGLGAAFLHRWAMREHSEERPMRRGLAWGFGAALLLLAVLLAPGGEKPPFIYFQF
jgi:hypothetical protein